MSNGGKVKTYTSRSKVKTGERVGKYPVRVVATRVPTMATALADAVRQHVSTHGSIQPGTPHIVADTLLTGLSKQGDLVMPI
jgi:hypothetical protein